MAQGRFLAWGIVIANLFLAIAVYCFARGNPPEIFAPFLATCNNLVSLTGVFGSAPSFLYTLALGLLISICASNPSSARLHCLIWIGLCLMLEITQLPALSATIMGWLPAALPEAGWRLVGPYWLRGVFDPIDLLATIVGGLVAMTCIDRLLVEENHASR